MPLRLLEKAPGMGPPHPGTLPSTTSSSRGEQRAVPTHARTIPCLPCPLSNRAVLSLACDRHRPGAAGEPLLVGHRAEIFLAGLWGAAAAITAATAASRRPRRRSYVIDGAVGAACACARRPMASSHPVPSGATATGAQLASSSSASTLAFSTSSSPREKVSPLGAVLPLLSTTILRDYYYHYATTTGSV